MNNLSYTDHYIECIKKASFDKEGGPEVLQSLTVLPINPKDDENYLSLINSLRKKIDKVFSEAEGDYQSLKFSKKIKDPLAFEETHKIFQMFYDQISESVYGCHFTTNSIDIYRSVYSTLDKEDSWLWHYDDNPEPQIKLFIYLSDVSSESAPFTYLQDKKGGARKIQSSKISQTLRAPQEFQNSRIPMGIIEGCKLFSYSDKEIIGKAGTAFIFDPNIIHKATIPSKDKIRDVLVYHIHPTLNFSSLSHNPDGDVKRYEF
tara:strand:+ start:2190 stop:2972 length:783 start_codon:yes stop_codon:yes gene_type:complete